VTRPSARRGAARRTGQLTGSALGAARFKAVIEAARQSGLLGEKNARISGRVSAALIVQAKRLTGIQTDQDLIEFALAILALEDHFADAFRETRGKVDSELLLGF
jgi:hypothetical protein